MQNFTKFTIIPMSCHRAINKKSSWVQSQVASKTLKMVLDTSLFNTQQYKVRIEGKVEQSREKSSTLPYTSV